MKVHQILPFHTNKKHAQKPKVPKKAFLEQLPNDVLIYALRQQFDISSLHTISHVSRRLRYLVGIVLSHYILPQVRLSSQMDQEGHGVFTSHYYFQHFDLLTFTATFQADPFIKRYHMDGQTDSPRLKTLSMDINSNTTLLYKINKPLVCSKRIGQTNGGGYHDTVYYYSSSLFSSSYTFFCWSLSYCLLRNHSMQVSICPNIIRIQSACFFGKRGKR